MRLTDGVVPRHAFDIGDFDFSELERVELASTVAVAPIAASPVAAAPRATTLVAAAPGPILFADGDDIVQQALAEAEAAPVKPMSARQRELLKKFNVPSLRLTGSPAQLRLLASSMPL